MKIYPKVPRHDHGIIEDNFYHMYEDSVIVLEKLDGCNFRFMLYEEKYDEAYTDVVREMAEDGDIVYGSRRVVKGTEHEEPTNNKGETDLRFMRGFEALQAVDKEAISDYHEKFGCPLVFYGECMTFHHKDNYSDDYDFLGFEVYVQEEPSSGYSGNPYNETFDGFLSVEKAFEILEDIGVETTSIVDKLDNINPEDYELPETEFGEGEAEGVVIRSDIHNRRAKKVHEKFREKNDMYFGLSETETPEEQLLKTYCTNGRMAKMMKKICLEESQDIRMEIIPKLSEKVYNDIWEEEWYEIKDLDMKFNPSEFQELVTKRCAGFTERIIKFSDDIGVEPIEVLEKDAY